MRSFQCNVTEYAVICINKNESVIMNPAYAMKLGNMSCSFYGRVPSALLSETVHQENTIFRIVQKLRI